MCKAGKGGLLRPTPSRPPQDRGWQAEGRADVRGCGGIFYRVAWRLRWRCQLRAWFHEIAQPR
eukprot:2870707-Lingulodinium_polyedra.AAC.1